MKKKRNLWTVESIMNPRFSTTPLLGNILFQVYENLQYVE